MRMQPAEEAIEKARSLSIPFIQLGEEERRISVRKPLTPQMSRRRQRGTVGQMFCNSVEQALDKRPELSIRGRPVPARMRRNTLIQMAFGNRKPVTVEQSMNLVVSYRKIQLHWQCSAQLTIFNSEAVPLQSTVERWVGCPKGVEIEFSWIAVSGASNRVAHQLLDDRVCEILAVFARLIRAPNQLSTQSICPVGSRVAPDGLLKSEFEQESVDVRMRPSC